VMLSGFNQVTWSYLAVGGDQNEVQEKENDEENHQHEARSKWVKRRDWFLFY
jgi:hypothetical protein